MTVGGTKAFCNANITYNDDGSTTDDYFDRFPPGYRFRPLDSELIEHYLMKKLTQERLPHHRIRQVPSVYKLSPEHLNGMFKLHREKDWYFFTRGNEDEMKMEYHHTDTSGCWRLIVVEPIIDQNEKAVIAYKRSLDYYEEGMRTDWKMQQYYVTSIPNIRRDREGKKLDEWILCRIYKEKNVIMETDEEEEIDTDEEEEDEE